MTEPEKNQAASNPVEVVVSGGFKISKKEALREM